MRGVEASHVWTGEPSIPSIADGAVVLQGERVRAVGRASELRALFPQAAWERHLGVITPGLVNARVSLELAALRARVPGGRGFVPWLASMTEARLQHRPELDAEAIDGAVSELVRFGTAAIGDVGATLAGLEALRGAPLLARVYQEIAGLRLETARTLSAIAVRDREGVTIPPNVTLAAAPHSLLGLHPDFVRELVGRGVPLRLGWTAAERAFLRDGSGPFASYMQARGADPADWEPPGRAPIAQADELGALERGAIVTHLTDASPEELRTIAERAVEVVLCPRASLHVEVKLPPLLALRSLGIEPALGTDSLASAGSLDVLDDVAALHARFPTVPRSELLAMATSWGARVLALDPIVGTIARGRAPGLVLFEGAVTGDPLAHVIARAGKTRTVLARPARSIEG